MVPFDSSGDSKLSVHFGISAKNFASQKRFRSTPGIHNKSHEQTQIVTGSKWLRQPKVDPARTQVIEHTIEFKCIARQIKRPHARRKCYVDPRFCAAVDSWTLCVVAQSQIVRDLFID